MTPHGTENQKDSTTLGPNPLGLCGIEFVEFASGDPALLKRIFADFGFTKTGNHATLAMELHEQNDIHFLINRQPGSYAVGFSQAHGPCVPAMGWRVKDPKSALHEAMKRGAKPAEKSDLTFRNGEKVPAIIGVGDSLIYFVRDGLGPDLYRDLGFTFEKPNTNPGKGFVRVDHLTNNVEKGTMARWSEFYKQIFGFTEIRYFDIRGAQTGLQSFALRSPDGSFCIPINEADEHKSQINEYLREYKGPGVQHLAFSTDDIVRSVEALKGTSVEMLDMDHDYYADVFNRVPHVKEDHQALERNHILVDGDEKGYLLQIFTRNIIGPIFIEIIQRKNNEGFGHGNFSALFKSIERDQIRRGVL